MLGAVVGSTEGIAPALAFRLGWSWFEFGFDAEYVFDLEESADSFFFVWTELSVWPTEWFRAGLAEQRVHPRGFSPEAALGLFVGFETRRFNGSVYVFSPPEADRYVLLGFGVSF